MAGGIMAGGHAWQGVMHGRGRAWQRDMHGRGCAWRGGGMRGRTDGHCSGQYASYWNAFVYSYMFTKLNVQLIHTVNTIVSGTFGVFNTYKHHLRNTFDPFLNGDVDSTCKRSLK